MQLNPYEHRKCMLSKKGQWGILKSTAACLSKQIENSWNDHRNIWDYCNYCLLGLQTYLLISCTVDLCECLHALSVCMWPNGISPSQ